MEKIELRKRTQSSYAGRFSMRHFAKETQLRKSAPKKSQPSQACDSQLSSCHSAQQGPHRTAITSSSPHCRGGARVSKGSGAPPTRNQVLNTDRPSETSRHFERLLAQEPSQEVLRATFIPHTYSLSMHPISHERAHELH